MYNVKLQRKNSRISHGTCGHGLLYNCKECSTNRPIFMQNKANFRKSQMNIKLNMTRDYEKKLHWTLGENKPNQSQSFDLAQDRSSNYPCVFELAVYNLVVRDGNGRNLDCPAYGG
jgi:hypothetical protein